MNQVPEVPYNKIGPWPDDVVDDFDHYFDKYFPAPEPREYQYEAIKSAVMGFLDDDKDVVLLDAPPGFGKSITLYTIFKLVQGQHYYVTPLKALQDQLIEDDFIEGDLADIRGRQNYECILDSADPGETVDEARCQRESDFDCPKKQQCPYYADKDRAVMHENTVMNLAYMMNVPMTPIVGDGQFQPRKLMAIDEVQGLEDWAMMQISVTFSKYSVPDDVWDSIDWPEGDTLEDYDKAVRFLREEVRPKAVEALEYIDSQPIKTEEQVKQLEKLEKFRDKIERFLNDEADNHWTHEFDRDVKKGGGVDRKLKFEPVHVGRFLDSLVWSRADKFILSSATLPKGDWLDEMGLGDSDVLRISIPSTFPVENRPIVTRHAVGKMTYNERDENIPKAVDLLVKLSEHHDGQKGIVHCRGYNYIEMVKKAAFTNGHGKWFRENVAIQDRDDREASLDEWQNGDKQVFLSVNMAEGIDLKGDKCRWQALLKTKYPNMGNKRVSYRINELNDWQWYNNKAVIQIEQAYGRAVRSSDDWATFYILDESAVGLLERSTNLWHDWFKEACDIDV